jgi:hypothetical protein
MDNQNSDEEKFDLDPETFFKAYKDEIYANVGLAATDQATKDALGEKIDLLIDQRVLAVMMTNMPSDKKVELAEMIEKDGVDASLAFAFKAVPDLAGMIVKELFEIRKDILEGIAQK